MERRERIILNSAKSKEQTNENVNIQQEFQHSNRPIPTEALDRTVNIPEVFKEERNSSFCYRFLGNLNIVASNVLFNWDGELSYEDIEELRGYDSSTGEYDFDEDEILKEDDGWFYYLSGDTSCDKVFLEPIPDRFSLYNLYGDTNWNVWLTYPAEANEETLTFNGVDITDGIAIYSGTTVTVDDRVMTAFICSINHGLSVDDEIKITGDTVTGYEGIHTVYKLGFGDGTYTSNVFIVDINLGAPILSFIGTNTSMKRRVEGIDSQYNGRWFKKHSRLSELEVYNTAFAKNHYSDQIYSYNFNKDYDISDLRDYLDRPVTDMYLTVVKKQDYSTSFSPFWTIVESGLKTILESTEYDINTINTVTSNDSIEDDVNNSSDLIFGDIVEYNPVEQRENVLEVAYHRFNSQNREDNNFLEGYYYKPHYLMAVRQFSDYIDEAFSGSTEAPVYATQFDDGRVTWRDVLPNNFSNGISIPFLNGCHYIYETFNLLVQRQDPCEYYVQGAISIISGDCDTDEQFEETEINDICE